MSTYTKNNPYLASLVERECLNKAGSSKATFHLSLSIDPTELSFTPGDSVAILPSNPKEDVAKILSLIPDADIIHPKTGEPMRFADFIEHKANLNRVTSPLLRALEATVEDRNAHDVISLIEKHQSIDAQTFANSLAPLLPRFYSIASNTGNQIDLLVSTFSYTQGGREKRGIGSDFLCYNKAIGDTVPLYVSTADKFRLPVPETPIIMIGPGTGVAPYRAFLQERERHNSKNWLFFGERNAATDFYYREYFLRLVNEDKLRLSTAFSRDQEEKIYVQHRLMEESRDIFSWLEKGATVYVCGDAKQMAKAVDTALHQIVEKEGGFSPESAHAFIKELRKNKRYLMDVY